MELLIESQQEKQNIALKCLNQVKTSKAVGNIIHRVENSAASLGEIQMYNDALKEAYENVVLIQESTSAMKNELIEWQNQLEVIKNT